MGGADEGSGCAEWMKEVDETRGTCTLDPVLRTKYTHCK